MQTDSIGCTFSTCADCGDVYTDEVPAYHDNNLEHYPEKEAIDCEHPGNIEYWYCPGCAEYFADACAEEYINPWITVDCVRPEDVADCAVVPCEVCGTDIYGYGEHDVLACQGGICGKCGDEIEGYGCQNFDTPACEDGLCYYCGGFVAGFGHENDAWAPCCDGKCAYGCGLAYPATEDHVDKDGDNYCENCRNHLNHTPSVSADELYCDEEVICTVCWATLGYGTKHTIGDWTWFDEEQHYRFCTGCDDNSTWEYSDHCGGTATCTNQSVCEDCGESYGALAYDVHEWSEPVYTIDGDTHTAHYTCNWDANHTKADDPAAHTFENGKRVCGAAVKFEILQQPVDDAAKLGETYSVTVEAEGDDLKYQWYFKSNGRKSFDRSSITTNEYTHEMNQVRHNRLVYCVITARWG